MAGAKMELRLEGGPLLAKKLMEIDSRLRRKHLIAAVRAGARILRDEARARAPVRTGTLRKSIVARLTRRKDTSVEIAVTFSKKGWYGRHVEMGHAIVRGGKVVGFASPRPFLRPAFDEKKGEAEQAVVQMLYQRLMEDAK